MGPTRAGSRSTPRKARSSDDLTHDESASLDYLERNRAAWQNWAPRYAAAGKQGWEEDELAWGMWGIAESDLQLLAGLAPGADVIEFGCGTGSLCASLERRGFHSVGIDFASRQIETAERFQSTYGVRFPLVCANAERVDFDQESFDCVISEYGTSIWSNPRRWVAEAARILRPDGLLVFVTSGSLLVTCTPADGGPPSDRLVRDYFSRYRIEFDASDAVEFHLTHGRWLRLLRANGLVVENLIETRPPTEDAASRFALASPAWAHRWPSEEIWVARKE